MIKTKSSFIYGFVVDAESTLLNFDEGSIELTAELNPGSYTLTTLGSEISRAFNAAGGLDYTVTVDRSTRKYTITSTGTLNLLCNSGSNIGLDGWGIIGFDTATDKTGSSSYEGENSTGSIFTPQYLLQDYVPLDNWQGFSASNVNESASGNTEDYSLGRRRFAEMNITNQNNGLAGAEAGSYFEYDALGADNLRSFMEFAITKGPMEFLEDRDDLNTFFTILLESLKGSKDGTQFKLMEMFNKKRAGWFETGKLKFREIS